MSRLRTATVRIAAAGAVIASAIGGIAGQAGASGTSAPPLATASHPPAATTPALPPGHAWTVTLLTGDVVGVRTVKGRPPMVTVRPGPGRSHVLFSTLVNSLGQIEVIPNDVLPLIGRVLDPTLFDVTALIRNGDDDAHRRFLPLIVQGLPQRPAAVRAALGRSVQPGTPLPVIGAVAVHEPKAGAGATARVLAAAARAVIRAGRVTPQVTGGITHIWLDRTVRVSAAAAPAAGPAAAQTQATTVLDHNLVQIGAPFAWRRGDNGKGVRVAVLDTGIDSSFPDLRGQVVSAKNFTSSSRSVADHFGHGTFVAALIAGTGRAAHGERRGVAFGARLVIGKVLGDDGFGLESWAIAGMQWAAHRAKVINMSFGGSPSDGTDPLSLAVNRLTARDHVLFVIAAGNSGPSDQTVTSPGSASAALTVGAVDGRGQLAFFSSRGPLLGDFAIKPEITAPGVNIVGARASGTSMGTVIDSHYTQASGTSFSTPEVAGAAAILAALHPLWGPARLKADLVATARWATGGDIYQLGGGQLNVAAEVTDPVAADVAVADLRSAADGSTRAIRRNLTWTNYSNRAATIELSARLADHLGRPAAPGAVRVAPLTIRVPAHGSASAVLTLSPRLLARQPGLFEGQVFARDGTRTLRTPISFFLHPPTHVLAIHTTPLPGTGPNFTGFASVLDLSDPDVFQGSVGLVANGTAKLTVPDGHYWVVGQIGILSLPSALPSAAALVTEPEVAVTRDTTVNFDGATAVPATASVPGRPTVMMDNSIHVEREVGGVSYGMDMYSFAPDLVTALYAVPESGVATTGAFHAYTTFRLMSPPSSTTSYVYDLYHLLGDHIPGSLSYTITPAEQARLAAITERFYAVGGNTGDLSEQRYGLTAAGFLAMQNGPATVPGGSIRTDYVTAGPGIGWLQDVAPPFVVGGTADSGSWVLEQPDFIHFKAGSHTVMDWARQPFAPGPYSATVPSISFCAPLASTRTRGNIHVELVDLQDLPDGFDCLGGLFPDPTWAANTSRVMRLYFGGRLLGTRRSSVADFAVPERSGTFRLTYSDNVARALPVSTRTATTWTFRSAVDGLAITELPLLVVRYQLPLSLDNTQNGTRAVLSASRLPGAGRSKVTGLRLWTSLNGGRSWQPAHVRVLGGGRFAATLPLAAGGQAVSLRVRATDAGGSTVEQTIIRAFLG